MVDVKKIADNIADTLIKDQRNKIFIQPEDLVSAEGVNTAIVSISSAVCAMILTECLNEIRKELNEKS